MQLDGRLLGRSDLYRSHLRGQVRAERQRDAHRQDRRRDDVGRRVADFGERRLDGLGRLDRYGWYRRFGRLDGHGRHSGLGRRDRYWWYGWRGRRDWFWRYSGLRRQQAGCSDWRRRGRGRKRRRRRERRRNGVLWRQRRVQ